MGSGGEMEGEHDIYNGKNGCARRYLPVMNGTKQTE